MSRYGQFCPVAKAMEVLDERWTLLVVRELLLGSHRFNDLRRGLPRMSPALLTKRLRDLERAGVVRREHDGASVGYSLTASGRELRTVVEGLGAWGTRWIGELGDHDLDPHLLFWDVRRTLPVEAWPAGCTVVAFTLTDVPSPTRTWWVVVTRSARSTEVDVCDDDPGRPVEVELRTTLRDLTRTWRGDTTWAHLLAHAEVRGPTAAGRALPTRFGRSTLAAVPRPEPAGV